MSLFPPGTNLNDATYLSFSADRNVAGFQLNGSGGTVLDALPALAGRRPPLPVGRRKSSTRPWISSNTSPRSTSGMQAVTDIMGQILGSESGGTCPHVAVNPPLTGLSACRQP